MYCIHIYLYRNFGARLGLPGCPPWNPKWSSRAYLGSLKTHSVASVLLVFGFGRPWQALGGRAYLGSLKTHSVASVLLVFGFGRPWQACSDRAYLRSSKTHSVASLLLVFGPGTVPTLGSCLPRIVPTLAKYDNVHYSRMPTLAKYDSFHFPIVPTLDGANCCKQR